MHLVAIAGRMVVHDHDVRVEPLQAPELVRGQDLPDEHHVVRLDDPHERDREIPRDAVHPEAGLALLLKEQAEGENGGTGVEDREDGGDDVPEAREGDGRRGWRGLLDQGQFEVEGQHGEEQGVEGGAGDDAEEGVKRRQVAGSPGDEPGPGLRRVAKYCCSSVLTFVYISG